MGFAGNNSTSTFSESFVGRDCRLATPDIAQLSRYTHTHKHRRQNLLGNVRQLFSAWADWSATAAHNRVSREPVSCCSEYKNPSHQKPPVTFVYLKYSRNPRNLGAFRVSSSCRSPLSPPTLAAFPRRNFFVEHETCNGSCVYIYVGDETIRFPRLLMV